MYEYLLQLTDVILLGRQFQVKKLKQVSGKKQLWMT